MSKERARRRQVRLAESARRTDAERRRVARRSRWRSAKARLAPRRNRVGRLPSRFSRAQTKIGVGVLLALVAVAFYLTESWPIRIAAIVLAALSLPVLLTISFDRRTR
jgi:Flp pilus assembly protein TadB